MFSVFVKSLQAEFYWDRSAITAGFLIWSLTNGASSVLVGRAVDRFHPKRVMIVGSIITTVGFFSPGFIQALPHFYLGYVIVGTGIASIGQAPCSALVSEWFEKKRGMAIGFMSIGVGVGGLIMPAISSGLLIPLLGWRSDYMVLGCIVFAATFPLALIVIRPKPGKKQEPPTPDREDRPSETRQRGQVSIAIDNPSVIKI